MTPLEKAIFLMGVAERIARIAGALAKGDDVDQKDLDFAHKQAEIAEDEALNTP